MLVGWLQITITRYGAKGKEVNEQELKITIDTKPIAGIVAAELEKKGVVSVDGELFALGPVMPGDVKPTQSGWYARNYGNWRSARDWWDSGMGMWWRGSDDGRSQLVSLAVPQNLQWRGINVEPNAQAIADAMFEDARQLASKPADERQEHFAAGFITGNPDASGDEAKDVARQYASCLDAGSVTGTSGSNQVPPVRNPTPMPDRQGNPIPQPQPLYGYSDPEGLFFDFDGVKAGKAIAWAVAAIIVVAILEAWASGAFK